MKIIDCQQGSEEWLQARLGIVTASELDALITPEWKIRTGQMPQTYLAKKIAERWRGRPLDSFVGRAMENGAIFEEEARSWYELANDVTIKRVGFITTDDGKMGCSPDGLLDDGGIEIKCPEPHTHVGWLLEGELPEKHRAQVYGSMLVTGAKRWRFMSYCRGFPPLVLTIEADAKIQSEILEAVLRFQEVFDDAWGMIEKRNGGPPVRSVSAPVSEEDLITGGL